MRQLPQSRTLVLVTALSLLLGAATCARSKHPVAPVETSYGTLQVSSTPPGARIVIDGETMDSVTPDDFALPAGSHTVHVVRDGRTFIPASATVDVPAEGTVSASFAEFAPDLTPAGDTHAFGSIDLGEASTTWCVTLTNAGTAPADSGTFALAGGGAAQFAIVSGAHHDVLAPGATHELCVAFRPVQRGAHAATIAIGSRTLSLSGTGHLVPCALVPSATAHDFGTQELGATPVSWCFDVTNDGPSACDDTLRLAGAGAASFAFVSGAELHLAPGATQGVCVEFRPHDVGAVAATITVGSASLSLAGAGSGVCAIGAPQTPDGTAFGAVCTESTATKRVRVPNTGNLACTVTASGCGPFTVSPATASVPGGGAATFTVSYQPPGLGALSCPVTFSDGTQSWDVTFSGTGQSPPVADFLPAAGIAGHAGDDIAFNAVVQSNGTPVTGWLWDFGDGGTSRSASPTHRFASGGSYTVTLTVTNGCGASPPMTHTICIDEPAYVLLYNFPAGAVPDFTTNIPGWGSSVPLVLYRSAHAKQTGLPELVCANVTVGEYFETGHDNFNVSFGSAEVLGTSGQSFETALLPVSSAECGATLYLSAGAPTSMVTGPTLYGKFGQCARVGMGQVTCDSRFCFDFTTTQRCALPGLDGRIEWGTTPSYLPKWCVVEVVRIQWNCWYVCPQSGPTKGKLQVVNAR